MPDTIDVKKIEPGNYWVRWYEPSWMDRPLTEFALFDRDHGFVFASDEPTWSIETAEKKNILSLVRIG